LPIPPDLKRYFEGRGTSLTGDDQATHQPLTARALVVGSVLSISLAAGSNYNDSVLFGTFLTMDFTTTGAVFLFLVQVGLLNALFKLAGSRLWVGVLAAALAVVLYAVHYAPFHSMELYSPGVIYATFLVIAFLANPLLAAMGRSLALNRSELMVVYIMLLIVSSVATTGVCGFLIPVISAVFYYASPENDWAEKLFPHLPEELMVNDGNGNLSFFEGIEGADVIPYEIWIGPLLLWAVFLFALYVTVISIAVILRRQWTDRERLSYPLVQVPQIIIRGEADDSLINPFFRSRLMWAGAAIPIAIGLLKGAGRYLGVNLSIPLSWSIPLYGDQAINLKISFAVLGFSYLIGPNIASGIWGFALLAKAEKMAFIASGVTHDQLVWPMYVSELLSYQGLGALLTFVGLGLWVGREHLRTVWRRFIGRESSEVDEAEVLSYRAAVTGVIGGVLVMASWFCWLGTPLWASLLFIGLALAVFTGVSRIIAESGVPVVIAPMGAPDFMIYGLGSKLLGPTAIANFSLSYVWGTDMLVFLMGACANGLKLIEGMDRRSRRFVFWSILVAIFVGVLGSLWTLLELGYRDGAASMNSYYFIWFPDHVYKTMATTLEPAGVYWKGLSFMGLGAVVMLLLTGLRQRFLWWPLHPIGFPIMTSWIVEFVWFSIFLAWLSKVTLLRYGGAPAYARSRHFFLGLIVGRALISGLWLVVDFWTGMTGNGIYYF